MLNKNIKHIVVSRTDSIGDVILTLPICHWLKENFKNVKISFLAKDYVRDVILTYQCIDEFISFEELMTSDKASIQNQLICDVFIHVFPNKQIARIAKDLKIPVRIGTSHRIFHWWYCNSRVNFTRKNSDMHESQLNFNLLKPLGIKELPNLEYINSTTNSCKPSVVEHSVVTFSNNSNWVVLHPKSKGSAKEWPIDKYKQLAMELVNMNYSVVYTGTENEGAIFRKDIPEHPNIVDSTGKLTLSELIYIISKSKALVACSTGPYHIAGLTGAKAIGLFSNKRPIFPKRWKAIGKNTHYIVKDENCENCFNGDDCNCIEEISTKEVLDLIKND